MLDRLFKNAVSNDFLYEVGRGSIPGHTPFIVTGNNPVATSTLQTVWDESGIYTYPPAPIQFKVSSANINDTLLGTGARTVFIAGLDTNGYWQWEIVTLLGQTAVLTEKTYTRINFAYIDSAGTEGRNLGKVYFGNGVLTTGVPATIYGSIDGTSNTQDNQIKQAIFSVPKGYRAIVTGFLLGAGAGKEISLSIYSKVPNGLMRGGGDITLYEATEQVPLRAGIAFPELTDIELRSFGAPSGVFLRATFTLVLERVDSSIDFILPGSFKNSPNWSF